MRKLIITAILATCIKNQAAAQNKETETYTTQTETTVIVATDTTKTNSNTAIEVTLNGVQVVNSDTSKKNKAVEFKFGRVDLGLNFMKDGTDYNSAEAKNYLQVPELYRNENLFSLRQGNSWNFNLWLTEVSFKIVKGKKQTMSLDAGLGVQIFNFKYSKPVNFENITTPLVNLRSDVDLSKNKLSVMYASIPLMLRANTKISDKVWLHYGFGVIGGLNMSTWTKQVSSEFGKEKNNDMFNTERFQLSLQGEIGLKDYFTFFGTYQLQSLFKDGIYQQPISIGLRF